MPEPWYYSLLGTQFGAKRNRHVSTDAQTVLNMV